MKIKLTPDKDIKVEKTRIGRVPVLVLRSKDKEPVRVGLLWIHGGGYILGMKEMVYMGRALNLVKKLGVTVLSPGYRLAWYKPYPAAFEDCYAVEEGMVEITEPVTTVRMLNKNTDKYINVTVPIDPETHGFAQDGDCAIAGVDGTAAELRVDFLNPAGSKTGKLLPTGNTLDVLEIPGYGPVEVTILDVSNPLVLVRAEDIGLKGTELPAEVDANKEASALLEKIRGTAACMMGFAADLQDATDHSPAVPKVGFFTAPVRYTDIENKEVTESSMDLCARVISVFKCHKACPLTAASSISVAAKLDGSIVKKTLGVRIGDTPTVRIGHPSGVMTMVPTVIKNGPDMKNAKVPGVAVQRTARRIMDGTLYIRN